LLFGYLATGYLFDIFSARNGNKNKAMFLSILKFNINKNFEKKNSNLERHS
jgi:hypothetical protein